MDDDQQFCLRWNNHQSTLVAVFDTLLENEKLVDCTLAAEGKFLNAHKVVLSACSPYFEALLSRHYDKHPILILKDVKFQELKAMMDYMYRGEVNISQDQLGALLKAAESLQIKGLSDNKKEEPVKRPAPAAVPPKSPQGTIPKVQGLTIEQRNRDEREGSMSPGPRKKKRMRRKSEELDNHHDASNSSDAQNIPSVTTQLPVNIKINSDVPDTIDTKQEILTRHKDETSNQQSQVPMVKEKLETHTELMLEPKSEYVDEMNEDSIEDLTLDDDDLSNMEQQMDDGAGPSHGGEGTSQQGFGHWQMGNQSQDEVFLAAQEAVGAHRDSQEEPIDVLFTDLDNHWTIQVIYPDETNSDETNRDDQSGLEEPLVEAATPVQLSDQSDAFRCPKCLKTYNAKRNLQRHMRTECGKEPQFGCTFCGYRNYRRNELVKHVKKRHRFEMLKGYYGRHNDATYSRRRYPYAQPADYQRRTSPPPQVVKRPSILKQRRVSAPQSAERASQERQTLPQTSTKTEPPKPSPRRTSGLLTDSLSCIFSRRNEQSKKVSYEETQEVQEPLADCPEPPRISQATPDIRMEDWFATKQRILGNVQPPVKVPVVEEAKCPERSQMDVDPHGFDIEPPSVLISNKNVSPYVPSHSYEREEYEKYKSEKLKNDTLALLHKRLQTVQENDPPEDEEVDLEKYHVEREQYHHQYNYYQDYPGGEEPEQTAPEAPVITDQDKEPQYYQRYDTTNKFKEPEPVLGAQNMCHKCSFQTTNPKKLREHLKFVHGETGSGELFSRREPPEELFTRRKVPEFKRRNTTATQVVKVISSDVVVPAKNPVTQEMGESGVMAALEYFETNKDQPKRARPYRRNPDQLGEEWV